MELCVEFMNDFDPSVLSGYEVDYNGRILKYSGSLKDIASIIDIIDSVTTRRSVVLRGGAMNEQAAQAQW